MSKGNREPRNSQASHKSPPNASKAKPKKQDLQREQIVQDRTAQLQATNAQLQAEIAECKTMQDKLRESEKSFRELVQFAPVGIYQVDFRTGKITSVNEVVCQQSGYTREELLNMNSFDILDEAGQALFAKRQQQWLAGEAPTEQVEYKIVAKDGHEIYAIMNVTFSRDEKGAPLGATVIAYDITERKRLEQQIQDIANKFLLLFDSTSDGVWISSPEGIILEVNEAYCRMSGYDEADLIGSPISLVEAAETEAEIGTHIHKLIEMGGHERFESRHRRKDGSTFDVDITLLYMEREGGQVATFMRDITERKRAEEALVRSNAKLGEVLDSIQDDFYVLDREWKFVYASRSFTNKVGKEPKDFIGNCIWEMFPKHIGTSLEENFRASMEKGEIRRFEIGGKYTQAWYSMTSFPSAEGITVLGTDITERKQAEERLLQSEERFRAIASSTPDHILVQDRDLRYTFVANPQLGLSEKDMLGKTDQDFLAKEFAEHLTALKKQVLESGKALQVDTSALNAEGRPEFFSGSYVPRFDAKGQVDGLIGYFRNITDLKQAEETLRQSEERYRMLVEQSADAIFVNREDKITLVNRAALDLFGADSAAQLLGTNPFDLFHSSHHALIRERMRTLSTGGTVRDIEVKVMRLDGGVLTAEVRAVRIVDAEGAAFQVILHDVTERKEREAELKRLNRTLKALSNNNQAMMRADDELAYMNEVCKIVVEDCGHAMVWIGVAEEDEAKSVRPVASAGFEEGYLDTLKVTWADTERGRGPTGTAIRTGKMSMCRNMLTDPHFAPWREEALKRGYAASIVLPLLSEGKAFGAITIYSREPDPFGESEVALLEELAGDLAYGITMIRTRQAHAQAQEALQQSEARFRQLADAAFEGLVIHEDGLLRDVNARITGMLGYESAELIGKQYWNFIDDKYHKLVKEKVRDGSTEPYEVELIHKDGRRVPVEVVGRPFLWQGRPAQVTALRDITERLETEEALRKSEQRFRSVLDNSVDVIYRLNARTGKFEYVSPSAENVIGYAPAELMAQDLEAALSLVHPEDAAAMKAGLESLEEAGTGDLEYRQKIKSGEYRWISNHMSMIYDDAGQPLYRDGNIRDITRRKQAEEKTQQLLSAVQAEKERLTTLINNISDEVWFADVDKHFTLANPAALREFGLDSSNSPEVEQLAASLEVLDPDGGRRPIDEAPPLRALRGEAVRNLQEIVRVPTSGELRYREVNASPVRDAQGQIIGAVSVVRDISERKKAEEALRESEKRYRTLFDSMSEGFALHEILCDEKGVPCDYRFLEVNPAFERLTGLKQADLIGKLKSEVEQLQGDDPKWVEIYGKVALTGKPVHFENYSSALKQHYDVFSYSPVPNQFAVIFMNITERKRTEEALRENERRFREQFQELSLIYKSSPVGLFAVDRDMRFIRLNEQLAEISGRTVEEHLGCKVDEILPGLGGALSEMWTQALEEGKPVTDIEISGFSPGEPGEMRHWLANYYPIKSEDGEVIGVSGAVMDITERKVMEEALRVNLAKYTTLFEAFPLGITVSDAEGGILETNREAAKLLGIPEKEHLRRKIDGTEWQIIRPDGTEMPPEEYASVRALKEKHRVENQEMGILKDGGQVTWISVTAAPLLAEGYGAVVTYSDITTRKKAEQALEKSNERQALLSETVSQLLKSTAPQEIVKGLCQKVLAHLDCQVFFNYLVEETAETETNGEKPVGHLRLNAYGGIAAKAARSMKQIDFGVAVCGCVARDGVRIVAENIPETPDPRTDLVRGLGVQAYACHPLMVEGKVIGTLSFGTRTRTHFSGEDLALMEAISDHVAIAMGRYKTDEALRQARDELELRVQERTLELQTTNEQLARERQRFNNVLDNLPAYLVLLTPDHHVPFANHYFEERFGKSEGRRCYEYLFNRSEPCENCQTYRTLKEDAPQRWEWTGPDKRIYDIHDFPFIDVDGSKLILEMGIDVTERRQAEAELERYRQHLEELVQERTEEAQKERTNLQKIFDVVNVGMMLIGEDGRVKRINDVIRRWTGKEEAEPGSLQPGDALACIHALSNPEGCGHTDDCSTCRIRKSFESVIKSGRPRHGVEVESTLVREGKQKHQWLDISADPLEVDGQRHVILALNDITARKEAEQALRQARDELEERVRQRTQELSVANAQLMNEVGERKQAQEELQANMEEMQVIQEELHSTNTSLLAAQANIESERRKYQNLFDFAPIIYLTTNTVGVIWEANKTAQDLLKSPDEPLIGKDLADFLTEPDQPGFAAMLYRLQQTEHIRDWETSLILPDGNAHQVSISASQVEDPVQGKTDLRWLIADISERKRTEALLRLQTTAMEAAASGIFITNRDGAIQYCNPSFTKMTGYTPEEVIGQTPRFLKSGRYDRAFYRQMWKKLLSGQVWHGEIINRRKDGSLYTEDEIITPVRDENGEVTHFIAVKQDISARRQAEEAIRQANAYNRSLLEASLDPLATITPEGKIGDVNSATEEVTGRKREELIGTDFHSYFSNPEKARLVYQKVFETGSVHDYELEIRHKDGHIVPVMYNASVYRDENSQVRGVFAVARDITERKRFEAQLVQAEKHAVIGRMVGSVTHEINNPLQTIKNCLYLIKQDIPGDSSTTEPLEMAVSETTRLSNLVGQLRELYRPRTDLQEHPHEVRDILEEVRALLTAHLNNSRVRWDPLTGMPRCTINCVRDQILEVFLNISMNAIEAMKPTGGTLSVEMKTSDEQVGLVFRDSGPGIPEEILPHIFEPFVTTKGSGLGLGLSISYGIIQRHGGQIVAENCPKGGASFTVWLPVARKKRKETKKNGHSRQHPDRG